MTIISRVRAHIRVCVQKADFKVSPHTFYDALALFFILFLPFIFSSFIIIIMTSLLFFSGSKNVDCFFREKIKKKGVYAIIILVVPYNLKNNMANFGNNRNMFEYIYIQNERKKKKSGET